jgi:hypothetical protein
MHQLPSTGQLEGVLKSEVRKNGSCFDIHHFARLAVNR